MAKERGAGADGFEDGGVDVAELRGGLNGLRTWLAGLVFEAGGVAGVLRGGGVGCEAGGDDDVVFLPRSEVFDFEAEAWSEIGELFVESGSDSGDCDVEWRVRALGGWFGDPDLLWFVWRAGAEERENLKR